MSKIIAGNWKMHGSEAMAAALARDVAASAASMPQARLILCPPHLLIGAVKRALAGAEVLIGGQDCHAEAQGAYTGDISAPMLKEAGCTHVIVGHSERRQHHGESDEMVRAKARAALAAGLIPIICIGETLAQREAGQAEAVVAAQLAASLPENAVNSQFLLAYEPIWAIGTGKIPTRDEIAAMHRLIAVQTGVEALYGGSVKPGNAAEILALPHVAGVLVGGASLNAGDFCAIAAAANETHT